MGRVCTRILLPGESVTEHLRAGRSGCAPGTCSGQKHGLYIVPAHPERGCCRHSQVSSLPSLSVLEKKFGFVLCQAQTQRGALGWLHWCSRLLHPCVPLDWGWTEAKMTPHFCCAAAQGVVLALCSFPDGSSAFPGSSWTLSLLLSQAQQDLFIHWWIL